MEVLISCKVSGYNVGSKINYFFDTGANFMAFNIMMDINWANDLHVMTLSNELLIMGHDVCQLG